MPPRCTKSSLEALGSIAITKPPKSQMEIAEGDLVAGYETWHGTHTGEFFGIPASGKPVTFKVNDIVRVANGKIVEHWAVTDNLSLMQQIGAIPEPDETGI